MAAERQSVDLRILKRARKRILDSRNWTQYVWATGKRGAPQPFHSDKAAKFCALGALGRAALDVAATDRKKITHGEAIKIAHCLGDKVARIGAGDRHRSIASINDSFGHAEVIKAFDNLIAKMKK